MELDKDNANPTILNPSDLPSRRRESSVKKREDGGTGLFDDLVPAYNYLSDPFDAPVASSDPDDDSVDEIDEQEIYGEIPRHALHMRDFPAATRGMTCFQHCLANVLHCRPHLLHIRSRAPALPGFTSRGKLARYPHTAAFLTLLLDQHGCCGNHPDHYALFPRYRHWTGSEGAARASFTSALPGRRPHQERHT